jgi:predicted transcriptional regulator YdeE
MSNRFQETSKPMPHLVDAFSVMGLFVRTNNAAEFSDEDGKIGPLWHKFRHGDADAIPGALEPGTTYAVYTDYESDDKAAYNFILGKSVAAGQQTPKGMASVSIPAARYHIFPIANSSPEAVRSAWMNVYEYFAQNTQERRAFTFDFEMYSNNGAKIFIATR